MGTDATDPSELGEAGGVSDLDHLLDLQANDTHADQLRHRHATLPERAELAELRTELLAKMATILVGWTTLLATVATTAVILSR